jgi:hypothetical protein
MEICADAPLVAFHAAVLGIVRTTSHKLHL